MSAKSYGEPNIILTRLRGSKLSKSPGRSQKSSQSPARNSSPPAQTAKKSPARKSPSRKPAAKSPARKSPSRVTKEVAEVAPQVTSQIQREPTKRPALKSEPQIRLEHLSANRDIFRTTRSKRLEYSVSDITSTRTDLNTEKAKEILNGLESHSSSIYGLKQRKFIEEVLPSRSSRLQEFIENLPSERKSLSKSVSQSKSRKSASKSIDNYSDEEISGDEFNREKSKSVTRRLMTPLRNSVILKSPIKWEFGGQIGATFLMILIPLTVLAIVTSCSKTCSLDVWRNLNQFKNLHTWFNWTSGYVIIQLVIQMFFALVPIFGSKADRFDDKGTKYCFNAFFSSIFTVNVLFLLDFYKIIDKNIILSNFLRLSTISYIFAVLLSIMLFVKSSKMDKDELNSYGNTGYVLYDYFMGREIHPFLKKLDLKIWISRISNINTLILSLLFFSQGIQLQLNGKEKLTFENYREFLFKVNLKPTILTFSMMQIIYILNFITREYKVTSTFFWNSEGLGYMQTVCSALYPFYFTTISKYVADIDLTLPNNMLAFALVIYVLGLLIMLSSNNIKHEFRSNPIHPSLASVKSIPTFYGKKLLISGLWGSMRHPNYTGDILIHLALCIPGVMTKNVIAASPALITIVVLLHRAWRDHARCKTRYGAAWQNYCKRVPSVFIPKVL